MRSLSETITGRRNSFVVEKLGALSGAHSTLVHEVLLVLAFNALLVTTAQISITLPFTIVPITGQTFGVLLTAIALGRVRALGVIGLYLLEGAAGLPVFAGGTGGLPVLFGPTGGYLLGFLAAAFVTGALADRGWDSNYWLSALALLIGAALIFVFGLSQLSFFVESSVLLELGFYPFMLGAGLKLVAAFWLIPTISRRSAPKSR